MNAIDYLAIIESVLFLVQRSLLLMIVVLIGITILFSFRGLPTASIVPYNLNY